MDIEVASQVLTIVDNLLWTLGCMYPFEPRFSLYLYPGVRLLDHMVALVCVLSHFSHVGLFHPMDCSPPGSSVLGILQARTLEWVSMPSSRGSSPSRDQTWVFCIALGFFTTEPLEKPMVALFLFFFFFFKGNSILFSLVLVSIYIPTTPKCRRVPLSQHLQHLSLANFLVVAILIDVR